MELFHVKEVEVLFCTVISVEPVLESILDSALLVYVIVYFPTPNLIGRLTTPLLSVVLVKVSPFNLRVTVLSANGMLPEVKATLNDVPAPSPNVVVLFTVNVGVLEGKIVSLLFALEAL